MDVKYIVIETSFGAECIVAFSEMLQHSEVAGQRKVISAGFIGFGADGEYEPTVKCWGRSVSLNKNSRPEEDTKLAERQLLRKGEY